MHIPTFMRCILATTAVAADPSPPPSTPTLPVAPKPEYLPPTPTETDVAYGKHAKQILNFWKAESTKPTPLIFFIHGGGWVGGNRTSGLKNVLPEALKNGISVVSVEYRFINEATANGIVPPVKGPMLDCARAL